MAKLFTTALVAVHLLGLAACAQADETAGNAADAGLAAGNLTGDDGGFGNDVTAVDGDAALGNGPDAALPADDGNAADLTGNAADPLANAQ